MERHIDVMLLVERKLLQSFPMIDVALLQHLRKFMMVFPDAFIRMRKTLPSAGDGSRISLQKLLKKTTHPLEVNCLRRTDILRIIFEGAVILMIQHFSEYKPLMWDSIEKFKQAYPGEEFQNLQDREYEILLEFRNLVVAANIVLLPKLDYFINLASKTSEGYLASYKNGSGRTKSTEKRIVIFRQETGRGQLARRGRTEGTLNRTQALSSSSNSKAENGIQLQQQKYDSDDESIWNSSKINSCDDDSSSASENLAERPEGGVVPCGAEQDLPILNTEDKSAHLQVPITEELEEHAKINEPLVEVSIYVPDDRGKVVSESAVTRDRDKRSNELASAMVKVENYSAIEDSTDRHGRSNINHDSRDQVNMEECEQVGYSSEAEIKISDDSTSGLWRIGCMHSDQKRSRHDADYEAQDEKDFEHVSDSADGYQNFAAFKEENAFEGQSDEDDDDSLADGDETSKQSVNDYVSCDGEGAEEDEIDIRMEVVDDEKVDEDAEADAVKLLQLLYSAVVPSKQGCLSEDSPEGPSKIKDNLHTNRNHKSNLQTVMKPKLSQNKLNSKSKLSKKLTTLKSTEHEIRSELKPLKGSKLLKELQATKRPNPETVFVPRIKLPRKPYPPRVAEKPPAPKTARTESRENHKLKIASLLQLEEQNILSSASNDIDVADNIKYPQAYADALPEQQLFAPQIPQTVFYDLTVPVVHTNTSNKISRQNSREGQTLALSCAASEECNCINCRQKPFVASQQLFTASAPLVSYQFPVGSSQCTSSRVNAVDSQRNAALSNVPSTAAISPSISSIRPLSNDSNLQPIIGPLVSDSYIPVEAQGLYDFLLDEIGPSSSCHCDQCRYFRMFSTADILSWEPSEQDIYPPIQQAALYPPSTTTNSNSSSNNNNNHLGRQPTVPSNLYSSESHFPESADAMDPNYAILQNSINDNPVHFAGYMYQAVPMAYPPYVLAPQMALSPVYAQRLEAANSLSSAAQYFFGSGYNTSEPSPLCYPSRVNTAIVSNNEGPEWHGGVKSPRLPASSGRSPRGLHRECSATALPNAVEGVSTASRLYLSDTAELEALDRKRRREEIEAQYAQQLKAKADGKAKAEGRTQLKGSINESNMDANSKDDPVKELSPFAMNLYPLSNGEKVINANAEESSIGTLPIHASSSSNPSMSLGRTQVILPRIDNPSTFIRTSTQGGSSDISGGIVGRKNQYEQRRDEIEDTLREAGDASESMNQIRQIRTSRKLNTPIGDLQKSELLTWAETTASDNLRPTGTGNPRHVANVGSTKPSRFASKKNAFTEPCTKDIEINCKEKEYILVNSEGDRICQTQQEREDEDEDVGAVEALLTLTDKSRS